MIIVVNFQLLSLVLFIDDFLVALSHKVYENHQTKISDFIAIKVFFYWLEP
jgi:NADH-quinone oxidoreductase subunit N